MNEHYQDQDGAGSRRLNILLITSEDNGPQFGCYGNPIAETPHIDILANEGAFFENAYATQAVCSPSRASILTGLYPHQNGQIGLATHAYTMHRVFPSLPGLLKDAGYRTGRIGKLHVLPESAFPFDFSWNDPQYTSFSHRDVAKNAEVAGHFISAGDSPFFLMVNYADAHLPWLRQDCGLPTTPVVAGDVETLPDVGIDSARLREHSANYYSCLKRLDTGIGMLLETLERTGHREDTLVIYQADHGPQFSRGKGTSYELGVRVPLMIRWPGMEPRRMIRQRLVSAIDVLPTALEAAGVEAPAGLPGKSLKPFLWGEDIPWRTHLFCEWNNSHPTPLPSFLYPQRTVRDARYKLIYNLLGERANPAEEYYTKHVLIDSGTTQWEIDNAPADIRRVYETWRKPGRLELYDLQADPHEFTNLADQAEYAGVRDALFQVLQTWQVETGDPLVDPARLARLVDEDLRVQAQPGSQRDPEFRWQYPDYLYREL